MTRFLLSGLTLSALLLGTVACKSIGPDPVPYTCESGKTLEAQYPTDEAVFVHYDGRRHRMTRVISASGARYASGNMEWHTKGTGPGSIGILSNLKDGEAVTPPVDTCTEAH